MPKPSIFRICITPTIISFLFLISSCTDSKLEYSLEAKLNPNGISPLTAVIKVVSDKECSATIKVLGESPMEQSFETLAKNLDIPVVGLYANRTNEVVVTLKYEGGMVTDTLKIDTEKLPDYFPRIEINKIDRSNMEAGMHLCDIHYAKNGTYDSRPFIFDDQGEVRWYLDLSFFGDIIWPIQRLNDGVLLVGGTNEIHEYDMLGKTLKKSAIDKKYRIHHDIIELPDGKLLIPVRKDGALIQVNGKLIPSFNDFIILYNRDTNKVEKEWDLAKHLDVSRQLINKMTSSDWLHMNGIAYDSSDNSIIVSGKNQGLIKISWEDELQWIMAPKKGWGVSGRNEDGFDTNPYLLTAVNSEGKPYNDKVQNGIESAPNFDFPWGQHAPKLLPNGNIILYDNGFSRNFIQKVNYSRAVEYEVDKESLTVKQNWQYGKERGSKFFSMLISDVDYLSTSKNILVTSGFIYHNAKIVEVSYPNNEEIFEATLYFSSLNGNKTFNWGQLDILYRSERFKLQY
ncbi:aryl-sulfate sulfotransferase [Aureisphaera galaxeae]|uniref:aryl-sulfate sulfotransferase n=1 Tax=Aureisphaera galaxeae TaxID=1538023 RepID=UPI0023506854|nr:aryl-sulfate sulfotransferase [Aureisphaera galaxeae]MDC8003412.1 aryl-sulfate sulfotransferase [Aureisphaera galaxeae]